MIRRLLGLACVLLGLLVAPATALAPGQVMRVGTYNVEYGQPVSPHVAMILADAARYRLDVLALQEVQTYQRDLRAEAPSHGYRFYGVDYGGSRDGFLVAARDHVTAFGHFDTGGWWWQGSHRARNTTIVWVIVNGVEYATLHAPVHAWTPCPICAGGRAFDGTPLVRNAYRLFVDDMVAFAWHRHTPLVLLGDWNSSPGARGTSSPDALRARIHGHFITPGRSTGHGEIDFAIATRALASPGAHIQPNLPVAHSDHYLVTFTIHRRPR